VLDEFGRDRGQRRQHRTPDVLGIVFDPAGPREVLRELAVGAADQLALQVEDEAGRPRRPLVDGEQQARRLLGSRAR